MEALEDRSPLPKSVWNKIADDRRQVFIDFLLDHEDLTARELAFKYTDDNRYFISESSAYRILREADMLTAPAYITICAADKFRDKIKRINELWQTDFRYFKIIGWGWYYLSTVLDDCSRYILSWKLCTTMKAQDGERLSATGMSEVHERHARNGARSLKVRSSACHSQAKAT